MTSGGNNFDDFPENQLAKFRACKNTFSLTFPWPLLNSLTFPGSPGEWPPRKKSWSETNKLIKSSMHKTDSLIYYYQNLSWSCAICAQATASWTEINQPQFFTISFKRIIMNRFIQRELKEQKKYRPRPTNPVDNQKNDWLGWENCHPSRTANWV